MTRLNWLDESNRLYEAGVDRGVLYPTVGPGVSWNGLISVLEAPSESDAASKYQDGVKYKNTQTPGSFAATIEAYTYPEEFLPYDGVLSTFMAQQQRKSFGLSYRTMINEKDYKLHLVYNATVSPTAREYATVSDSIDAATFSWPISTLPVLFNGVKAGSHFIIDTTKAYPETVAALEAILYGSESMAPYMPSPDAIFEVFEENAILRIVDNGDGTWTATGPDEAIQMLDDTTFAITWPSVVYIDDVTYTISSL